MKFGKNVIIVDIATREASGIAQLLEKNCDRCGGMNHFKTVCRSSEGSNLKSKLRKRSDMTNGRKCTHRCKVHEINESCHQNNDNTGVEGLTEQVQSLFYQ